MVFIVLLRHGPIAQLAEPPAHNRKVPGSIPGGPINNKRCVKNAPLLIFGSYERYNFNPNQTAGY